MNPQSTLSPRLFPDVTSWNRQVFLSGFLYLETNETLSDELKKFLEDGKKPIVVTFSSMPLSEPERFLHKLVQAFNAADERAVILTGNSGITGNSSKDCFFTESCPHLSLFQYATGVVHHGGAGTMASVPFPRKDCSRCFFLAVQCICHYQAPSQF